MSATTPRHGLPYPTSTDPLHTYDDILKSLAETMDEKLDVRRHTNGLKYAKNLAYYEESQASLTGWIVIQTNMVMGYHMMRYDIKGYTYWPYNNIIDLSITMYDFTPDNTFYNYEVNNKGSMNFTEIRLLTRTSDGKLAIALYPDTSGNVWHYPKMTVDAYFGHTEATLAEMTNWSITRVANTTAYSTKRTLTNHYWTYPTLGGGWVNYGSGYTNTRFRKSNGMVYIQGLIANGTMGSAAFVLPEGCRPSNGTMIFGTNGSAGAHRTDIDSAGNVVPNGGTNNYHSLSGISFPAER